MSENCDPFYINTEIAFWQITRNRPHDRMLTLVLGTAVFLCIMSFLCSYSRGRGPMNASDDPRGDCQLWSMVATPKHLSRSYHCQHFCERFVSDWRRQNQGSGQLDI